MVTDYADGGEQTTPGAEGLHLCGPSVLKEAGIAPPPVKADYTQRLPSREGGTGRG